MIRIEVLEADGYLAGFFFPQSCPISECRAKTYPIEFEGIYGEWIPNGGVTYEATGLRAWYRANVSIGLIEELPDKRR